MQKEERHGFHTIVLFVLTFGFAYYLWKEIEKLEQRKEVLEDEVARKRQSIVDIAAEAMPTPEQEPEALEPAHLSPPLIEDRITVDEPVALGSAEETTSEDDSLDDEESAQDEFEARLQELETSFREQEIEPAEEDEFDDLTVAHDKVFGDEPSVAGEPKGPVAADPAKPPAWVRAVDGKCPDGYPVKARFATGHYHEPGDRGYDKIAPDCCYPTVEDAEADGFTASRWS